MDEFCNFYDSAGSVLYSQHYIHPRNFPVHTDLITFQPFFSIGTLTVADRRRSNVVKEIDRLAKNREQRRAKQQEVLEEKSAKQNVDPGNPNWEFLCMIREYQESLDFNPLQVTRLGLWRLMF